MTRQNGHDHIAPEPYHPDLGWRVHLLRLLPPATPRTLRLRRWLFSQMSSTPEPGISLTDDTATANGRTVPIRIYRPHPETEEPRPVLLWLHGGGFVVGTHTDDRQCSRLANELNIVVVSADYRLAPENPYPAALDDIETVVSWLDANQDQQRLDMSKLVLGGQSAGAGLAASATQRLHDAGLEVRAQLLIYPMLDDRTAGRTTIKPREHLLWNNISNKTGWTSYLGVQPGSDLVPADAVPARRQDLAGLPPAWIGVGTRDLFHDENIAYANRLRDAGVDCELFVAPGMIHGFDVLLPNSKTTTAFNTSQDNFLRSALQLPPRRPPRKRDQ